MRPEILFPLFARVNSFPGVGEKTEKLLKNLCGDKGVDFLWHFPTGVIDRTYSPQLVSAKPGVVATVKITITEHVPPRVKGKPYRVIGIDGTEQLVLSFFKVYEKTILKNLPVGAERVVSGKLEFFNGVLQMSHPDYIVLPSEMSKIMRMEPVYPLTAGISNKLANKLSEVALSRLPDLSEWLDAGYKQAQKLPSFNEALKEIHHPRSSYDLEPTTPARTRLAYDELLANQLSLALVRQKVKKQAGRKVQGNGALRQKILESLPFELTVAQKKVLQEIFADQASGSRMLRLLQGDVGSGKTIVALMAMLNAVECGFQAAIMAPTEILAKQHFESLAPMCEAIGVRIELLTGKVKGKKREAILEDLREGRIHILAGTHALFTEDVAFHNLACAVIDEQHRFGVHQRLALSGKGNRIDILVMTATPIPRTLLLTAYGDMEYSKIDELPKGRKPVKTSVMPINKVEDVIEALKRKISEGERAYWVCPLVEESEKLDLQAAKERFESLQKVFGEVIGIIHGRMNEKEKDAAMADFKTGKTKLLVATTVIEVGVNVPEATIMVIEHAERFGLAQLHQLRGRIKRGFKESSCLLLYTHPMSETTKARLNIMRETEDGFRIAEEDLDLRGGGEILGTRQSGFCNFRVADMAVHKGLLLTASKDAKMILEKDPELKSPRGEALRTLLYLFERDEAVRTYLAG